MLEGDGVISKSGYSGPLQSKPGGECGPRGLPCGPVCGSDGRAAGAGAMPSLFRQVGDGWLAQSDRWGKSYPRYPPPKKKSRKTVLSFFDQGSTRKDISFMQTIF